MEKINWASIAVAIIGVVASWLAGKSAKAASKYSSDASIASERSKAETDAYTRARQMDTETIERQGKELTKLREENEQLRIEMRELSLRERSLSEENIVLRSRVERLERYFNGRREQR